MIELPTQEFRVLLTKLLAQSEESFFRSTIARDQSKGPIRDLVIARIPFVGPGKQDGASQSAFHHTVDMPAQHIRLFAFGMSKRVQTELIENEWALFR